MEAYLVSDHLCDIGEDKNQELKLNSQIECDGIPFIVVGSLSPVF